ncbi:amidohydrolase [bacterium]|nr:amidohydrolase [candidate division CSSED10-310 bacterium]
MNWLERVREQIRQVNDALITDRHWLHMHPELSGRERGTAEYIATVLKGLGLTVHREVGDGGIVCLIQGDEPGPTVLWRTDMDGLPVQEANDVDYRSVNEGVMHACGHDAHMAIGLAIARVLAARQWSMRGAVKLVFQPNEEIDGGAERMIEDGVLDNPKVDYALGLHVDSTLDSGSIGLSRGPTYASCNDLRLVLRGPGGHGAHPEETADLVVAAAQIITNAQALVARTVSAFEPVILSFCAIHGGTVENIIPSEITILGTVRVFDSEVLKSLKTRLEKMLDGILRPMGADYGLSIEPGYPPLVNRAEITDVVAEAARQGVGAASIFDFHTMGAEDMSYFLQAVPGCYFQLGVHDPREEGVRPHHSPRFDVDDRALPIGLEIALHSIRLLQEHSPAIIDHQPSQGAASRHAGCGSTID